MLFFTVGEEVGLKGGRTSLSADALMLLFVSEVTFHRRTILGTHKRLALEIGKGPGNYGKPMRKDGIIVQEPVLKWLKNAAESGNIPYQQRVGSGDRRRFHNPYPPRGHTNRRYQQRHRSISIPR